MARILLKAGEAVHFLVLGVNQITEDDKLFILFRGSTLTDPGAEFVMAPDSALRQLDRLQYNWSTVVGQTVEFSKVKRGDRTFIDINRADPLGTGGSAAPTATPLPPAAAGFASAGAVAAGFVPPARQAPPGNLPAPLPGHTPPATAPLAHAALPAGLSAEAKAKAWSEIIADLQMCLGVAVNIAEDVLAKGTKEGVDPIGYTSDNVCSLASTLFIAGQKRGLVG